MTQGTSKQEEAEKVKNHCETYMASVITDITDLYFNVKPQLSVSISCPSVDDEKYSVVYAFHIFGLDITILHQIKYVPDSIIKSTLSAMLYRNLEQLIFTKIKEGNSKRNNNVITYITYRVN